MAELRIVASSRGRSQAEDLEVELHNLTGDILVGSVSFHGAEIPILPVRSGSAATIQFPTSQIRSKNVLAGLNLRTFPKDDLVFTEGLDLDANAYRRYVVELFARDGERHMRIRKCVQFQWSAGNPRVTPVLHVTDDGGETYTLTWPPLSERENGPLRQVLLDGEVRAVAVSGTYLDDGEDWYIQPDDEESLELMIEGAAGFYLLERNLDDLDDGYDDEDEDE